MPYSALEFHHQLLRWLPAHSEAVVGQALLQLARPRRLAARAMPASLQRPEVLMAKPGAIDGAGGVSALLFKHDLQQGRRQARAPGRDITRARNFEYRLSLPYTRPGIGAQRLLRCRHRYTQAYSFCHLRDGYMLEAAAISTINSSSRPCLSDSIYAHALAGADDARAIHY